MSNAQLLAIEAELEQIQRDIAAGNLSASEARELLKDIDVAKLTTNTADELAKKTQVQALLDATVTLVSAVA